MSAVANPPHPQTTQVNTDRQNLILEHYPLVRAIAYKIHQRLPRAVELDDLISAGVMGLMEAIDRYDPSRKVPFEPYAKHRIHGAIVDGLRAADWVPRSVRRKADRIERERTRLQERLGRLPTRKEMAGALEVTPKKYDNLVSDSQIRQLLSLDSPVGQDNPTPLIEQVSDSTDLMDRWQAQERRKLVIDAIQNLPEREKTAIALYYLHELSLKEVGGVLGVTESRACQLTSKGVKRLRFRLRRYIEG